MLDLELALQRAAREREARKQAETLLEEKSRELFEANQALRENRDHLERRVVERTAELVALNAQLQHATSLADAANRAKSEFLANMSHEIRTPMTAILGFADLLAESVTDPESAEAATLIRQNGEYLLEILNDILDLSKIEAGRLSVQSVLLRPHQLLAEVASLMRLRATAKGLTLSVEYAGPIPELIRTDPVRLRQILINLVGNAIKFTEAGGVQVRARLLRDHRDPRLQFDIVDTGIGLTEDQQRLLFRPFTQADASTTRKHGGTGLGLAISKRLATLLGGDIVVRSTPRRGSTFSLTIRTGPLDGLRMLPDMEEMAYVPEPSSRRGSAQVKLKGRILVAEDAPHIQRFLTRLLEKAGAEVTVVDNGQAAVYTALAAAENGTAFDAVVMDVQMPVLDGYAATRQLRANGYRGQIVALTAHALIGDREECLAAGCDHYAAKPVDRGELLELLALCLQRAAAAVAQ